MPQCFLHGSADSGLGEIGVRFIAELGQGSGSHAYHGDKSNRRNPMRPMPLVQFRCDPRPDDFLGGCAACQDRRVGGCGWRIARRPARVRMRDRGGDAPLRIDPSQRRAARIRPSSGVPWAGGLRYRHLPGAGGVSAVPGGGCAVGQLQPPIWLRLPAALP